MIRERTLSPPSPAPTSRRGAKKTALLATVSLVIPAIVIAICTGAGRTSSTTNHYQPSGVTSPFTVGLKYTSGQIGSQMVQSAIGMWTGGCPGAGVDYPNPLNNQDGLFDITLNYGVSSGSDKCASRSGNTITLYGAAIRSGQPYNCTDADMSISLAHELGHWYGLSHTSATAGCASYIMYPGTGNAGGNRTVQSQECTQVKDEWVTLNEPEHPSNSEPEEGPEDDPEDPSTGCEYADCVTPIIVDVRRNGFRLTGLGDTVMFDIDADGIEEELSWTDGASDDAFLALDRNGNGTVDDGSELFGAISAQPPGPEPNGFRALAVFDGSSFGGDGDGWISPDDSIYSSLLLWTDRNHDGVSQAVELSSLSALGIEAIKLTPVVMGRRDRYGNRLRWGSLVEFGTGSGLAAVDVILLRQP